MNGVQHQVLVFAQSIQQSAARLLQSHRHRPPCKTGGPLQCPSFDSFGCVLELSAFPLPAAGHLQSPGMLVVGPVDGDESSKIRLVGRKGLGHGALLVMKWMAFGGLAQTVRSAYSRVWSQTRSEYSLRPELRQPDTLKVVIA